MPEAPRLYALRNCKFVAHLQGESETPSRTWAHRLLLYDLQTSLKRVKRWKPFSQIRAYSIHISGGTQIECQEMDRTKTAKTLLGNIHSV
jgi:hypothetical protein